VGECDDVYMAITGQKKTGFEFDAADRELILKLTIDFQWLSKLQLKVFSSESVQLIIFMRNSVLVWWFNVAHA